MRLKTGELVLFDRQDYEKVAAHYWAPGGRIRSSGAKNLYIRAYICGNNSKRMILLHRVIMDAKSGELIDHINHDYLDNRRTNLRFATHQQNSQNRHQRNTKKEIAGVTYRKDRDGYRIRLKVDGKMRSFGYCKNLEDAEKRLIELKNKYYGEFSPHWKHSSGVTK